MFKAWENFKAGQWQDQIDVRDFIQKNYTLYEGDDTFLAGATENTRKVWSTSEALILEEGKKGVLGIEENAIAGVNNFEAGYILREAESIVGLQTDAPLKRIINPYGGFRMVEQSLEAYGFKAADSIMVDFPKYRKTHNEGVFHAYTEEMKAARSSGLITGLPDSYGRGRIIGDYRRVALYGVDYLIAMKKTDLQTLKGPMNEERIRAREEVHVQMNALEDMKKMAEKYGVNIALPAQNAKEAVQYLYFGYLAAVKENNGAAMSLGRTSTFLDCYIERDLQAGIISESYAQELIDQFVIKLRLVRHLRTPEYDELFAGDPTWVTESIGGVGMDGRPLVTKSSFRFLHTLVNLGTAPEPNMTVLWSQALPENFKKYCAHMSILTDSIQYENDDLMRDTYGDDYGIACCVSAMTLGKQMQFFGARCNLGKALLYALNGGVDEKTGKTVIEGLEPLLEETLDYGKVRAQFDQVLEYVAELYVDTMNIIHYMHDRYAYEGVQMALHDTHVDRLMAFGVAGLSVAADSLSAIKHAKVRVLRDDRGITKDFVVEGDFPKFGNDDDRVDELAIELVEKFSEELRKHATYRNAKHTLSVLTITSNVVYGKKTGATPDGRKAGEAFAPGANPMHGRDLEGALASLNSVAKIPYCGTCDDGVSNTFSIVPDALGKTPEERILNLSSVLDGYFAQDAHHLNVNVFNRSKLEDAMLHPEKYPSLTIRVSGYAVNFNRLSKAQQMEVISRTFHEKM